MSALSNESMLAELLQADGAGRVPAQSKQCATVLDTMRVNLASLAAQAVEWAAGASRDPTQAPVWTGLNGVRMSKRWDTRTRTQVQAAQAIAILPPMPPSRCHLAAIAPFLPPLCRCHPARHLTVSVHSSHLIAHQIPSLPLPSRPLPPCRFITPHLPADGSRE
jgi:hypothetical protein